MDLLKKYESDLKEIFNLNFINSIIIFGSYANGKESSLSDLDVCIISKKNLTIKQIDKIYSYKTEDLDVYYFDDLSLPIQFKIMTGGVIFQTKSDILELKNNIINQWFDYRPILNRIYESKNLLPIM